jgi:hypothetical protein
MVFVVTVTASITAVVFIDLKWNHRAAYICNEEAAKPPGVSSASGYSIQWDWTEFAYVCSYHAPGDPTKRVGFTDVFL